MSLSHQWEKKHHHWRKTVFSLLSGFGNSLVQHCGTVASYEADEHQASPCTNPWAVVCS